jgi:hypothetical protein
MIANSAQRRRAHSGRRATAWWAIASAALAATGGIMVSAMGAPVRLVGVSARANAVLIEATEPVAYSVGRPTPLSLVVDMRNVSVSDAQPDVDSSATGGAVTGVRLEQTTAADGRPVARVHLALARPSDYRVRSERSTIRVELTPKTVGVELTPKTAAVELTPKAAAQKPATAPAVEVQTKPASALEPTNVAATVLERIRSRRTPESTTVTLSGNGRLAPERLTESEDRPRRLVLDFPNVTSRVPSQTAIDSPLVKRVRVGLNSHEPIVTRVVMEIAPNASYHVERAGEAGRDLAVVFAESQAKGSGPVMLAPPDASSPKPEPEPALTMQQAIANAAAITPPEGTPLDPMTALNSVNRPAEKPATAERDRPAPAPPAPAPSAPQAAPQASPRAPDTPPLPPPSRQTPVQNVQAPAEPLPPATPPARAAQAAAPPVPPAPAPAAAQVPAPPAAPPAAAARTTPPQQAQTQPPPAPSQPQAPKQFTGVPISMDFEGVDLRAVLRTFADVSGLNIVIDQDVQGSVDIKLTDVPWDQALDVILRGNQLDYTVEGTIVRISRIKTLEDEHKARQAASAAAAERAAQAGGLAFETFPLSYAKAAEIAPLLKNSLRLSKWGQVQVDTRTNTLIVADLPEQFQSIRQLLSTLDRAEPQVEVEARIVQTTRDFARAIGVQ